MCQCLTHAVFILDANLLEPRGRVLLEHFGLFEFSSFYMNYIITWPLKNRKGT